MAWFDKRISKEKLEKMDEKFVKRYGRVKYRRERDVPFEPSPYDIDEETQITKDSVEECDVDESAEEIQES